MISTCILPNIESVTALSPKSAVDSPHENLNRFIEIAWMFIETNHGKVLSLFSQEMSNQALTLYNLYLLMLNSVPSLLLSNCDEFLSL